MKIYIIAGEVSGDQLAARFVRSLKAQKPDVELRGIGGSLLAEQGLESQFDIKEFAIMGLVEVLRHVPRLKRRMREIAADIRAFEPDVLLTVDSPGLSLRIHKMFSDAPFKQVHFVAPTVWAWKPWRAKHMAGYLDHLLVILPFEPPYFTVHGLATDFVGHPVTELLELATPDLYLEQSPAKDQDSQNQESPEQDSQALRRVIIAPGSRKGEVSKLLPDFIAAATQLYADDPSLHFVVPTVETVEPMVREMMSQAGLPHEVIVGQALRWSAFKAADLALVASGTIALELGLVGTPTVVAYRVNALTARIVKAVVKVEFASLINILNKRAIQPELLQWDFTPEALLAEAKRFLYDAEAIATYKAAVTETAAMLAAPKEGYSPSELAAEIVQALIPGGHHERGEGRIH